MKTRVPTLLGLSVALVAGGGGLLAAAQADPAAPSSIVPPWIEGHLAASRPTEATQPNQLSVEYTFPAPVVARGEEYDSVTIPGLESHGEPGAPVLPFKTAKILLPAGTALENAEVIAGEGSTLQGSYLVEPGQELIPAGFATAGTTPPDPALYGSATPFPGQLFSVISVQRLTGYTILLVSLYPVQYVPAAGELTYHETLTVRVTTASSEQTPAAPQSTLRNVPGDADRVRELVDNPQVLDTYTSAPPLPSPPAPQASIVDAGDPYDYVIITSDVLSSTFQPLAGWKASQGLLARIYSTQEITAAYSGDDDPERIRNFIVDAYNTWAVTAHPLQYVVLGGDDEIIPIRSIYVTYAGYATWMPVDLYYGGLDGDWDADGDGNYGEPGSTGAAGEECDFFAEVYVGRMTVETITETMHIVSKTIAYEGNPTADYLDRALWLGNKLDDYTWGGNSKDVLSALIPQYNVTALYSRDGTYSTSAVINAMNAGTHLVNFDGHGNYYCCPLNRPQIDALANDDYFLHYNLGCITAGFDQAMSGNDEAVAEHYVFTEHGAFAYIGNTRYGWYSPGSTNGPGNVLDRYFFDTAVNTDDHNIGKALQLAKEKYYPGHRWSILTLSLLGDPETPLVTELPVPVANISAPKGGSTIKVTVDVVGTAREGDAPGATFDHYVVEYGSGTSPGSWTQIGVTSTTPVSNGTLTAWDTTVLPDGTYTLRLTVDDGAGETSSHRNVVKTDNLYITSPLEDALVRGGDVLTITGSALGTDLQDYVLEYGRGSSPSSWTFILSSTVPVTNSVLGTWDTSAITATDDYTIRLTRHGTAHNSSERVTVYIEPLWQAGWPQSASYRFVAPSMAAGDIDGDGDLELVATAGRYDRYNSYVYAWHHDGTPVTGWPKYVSGKRTSAPALADIDRDGDLEIVVGAYDKKVYAWHHNGNAASGWPQETGGEVFASPAVADLDGDGIIEIVAASLDEQVYVWHYDGTAVTGWPQAAGGGFLASPAVGDLDADGDLEIVAARRGAVYAWHHDGSAVAGWPISITSAVTVVSSVALGNITGSVHPEVLLGVGDQVYAWHHDGSTVAGWPQAASGAISSSVALGDLDGDADLEILVGSDQVHAWHHDGSTVAGWPVSVTQHTNSSPVLGDVTGDGNVDVVIGAGDEDEHLYAWARDGTPVSGWPRWVPARSGSGDHFQRLASPLLTDLDQDGDVEVALGAESYVFVYDMPAAYSSADLEWPQFQHDRRLTGWYTSALPNMPPFVRSVRVIPWYVTPGGDVTISAEVTDEDGVASVTVEIESPDETIRATLTLYDDGLHDDGAAGDGVYGSTWTTLPTGRDYVLDITAADIHSKSTTHDNIADFTTQDAPYVRYVAYTVNEEYPHPNNVVNPGESVRCSLTLENLGVLTAPSVTATLYTNDEHLWWYTTDPITFGHIAAGGTVTSADTAFDIQVKDSCPHSYTVVFDLTIKDALDHTWVEQFGVPVLDNVGPDVYFAEAIPSFAAAGEPVTITANVEDPSGVSSVRSVIESPDESPVITLTLYDDGAHGDWSADDGTYGNIWTTTADERIYEVDLVAEDGMGNVSLHDNKTSFATKPFSKTAEVLLVADGGWGATGSFRPYYATALDEVGVAYDLWDGYFYGYGALTTETLRLYTDGAVIWAVPSWGEIANQAQQDNLSDYLSAGGKLFISGQNLGESIGHTNLYTSYLHATHVRAVYSHTLTGVAADPIGDGLQLSISGGDGADNQFSPDEIAPLVSSMPIFTYTESASGGVAAIRVDAGTYKAVYFSFGFEAINDLDDRAIVMGRVLSWLLGGIPPRARFSAWPTSGSSPLTVIFTNTSTGIYSTTSWSFGDGLSSALENPTHTYTVGGVYTVALTVNGGEGKHTLAKPGYITVQTAPPDDHKVYLPLILRGSGS
jgi:hypothetical protein